MFHQRYHLLVEKGVVNDVLLTDVDREFSSVSPTVLFDSLEHEIKQDTSLDERQKYNIITPMMVNMPNIITCHPTEKGLSYVDEISSLERRARKGYPLLSTAKQDREKTDEGVSMESKKYRKMTSL